MGIHAFMNPQISFPEQGYFPLAVSSRQPNIVWRGCRVRRLHPCDRVSLCVCVGEKWRSQVHALQDGHVGKKPPDEAWTASLECTRMDVYRSLTPVGFCTAYYGLFLHAPRDCIRQWFAWFALSLGGFSSKSKPFETTSTKLAAMLAENCCSEWATWTLSLSAVATECIKWG